MNINDPIWWGGALYGVINNKLRKTSQVVRFETIDGNTYAVTKNTRYHMKFSGPVLAEAFDYTNSGDPECSDRGE